MVDGSSAQLELVPPIPAYDREQKPPNPLEGAIVLHGLQSNISAVGGYKENEIRAILGILSDRAVIPYGLRTNLTSAETQRTTETSWDRFKISFWAYHGEKSTAADDPRVAAYVGQAAFVAPLQALEGLNLLRNGGGVLNEYTANSPKGARIPLEGGLLFIGESLFLQMKDRLLDLAVSKGVSPNELLGKHVYIVEDSVFRDTNLLWKVMQERISPAKGVKEVSPGIDTPLAKTNLATAESLGVSALKDGSPISIDLMSRYDQVKEKFRRWNIILSEYLPGGDEVNLSCTSEELVETIASIQKLRFEIEKQLQILELVDEGNPSVGRMRELLGESDTLSQRADSELEQLYQDAPVIQFIDVSNHKDYEFEIHKPECHILMDRVCTEALSIGNAYVWRGTSGKLHVDARYY